LPAEVHELVSSLMHEIGAGRRRAPSEWEDFRKDGSRVWMQWRSQPIADHAGQPIGVVSVGTDVSARRVAEQRKSELEAQLYHAQKMETMGMLSSGIAHDFNNILAAILMQSEVALADPEATPRSSNALKEIRAAGLRAKALVRRILNFSRREEPELAPVDLAALLDEVVNFVRATLPPSVEIRFDRPDHYPATLADENRLHQVFVNLSSNAAAAMPRGGVLDFSLGQDELSCARTLSTGTVGPGKYLTASVGDTGSGMGAETVARMFEPFFTTKRAGEGTGLGLAIVASIISQHGGAIQVDSAPGTGSRLTVFLPVLAGDEPFKATATPTPPRILPRGNGEHILVLDDEESLALLMRATLETLGYRASHATSAFKVLADLEARPRSFDLIVTDQNMPELTGVELARRARAAGVELPIVIATGFGAPLDARGADDVACVVVLEKPFEVERLARLVRRLLDARGIVNHGR
jgi:signal transduction histidine kinase/CheY-like chemotaxis protein